jgi:hypothetical protein
MSMWARMALGGNAGRATRVRTFAVRDAVLTGWGVAGMNMESVKQEPLFGCVGGEVVPVRSGSKFPRLAVTSQPSRGRLYCISKWHPLGLRETFRFSTETTRFSSQHFSHWMAY